MGAGGVFLVCFRCINIWGIIDMTTPTEGKTPCTCTSICARTRLRRDIRHRGDSCGRIGLEDALSAGTANGFHLNSSQKKAVKLEEIRDSKFALVGEKKGHGSVVGREVYGQGGCV